jgi:hypothetical protein
VPTFVDRGRRLVSATDHHGHNLGFLDYMFSVLAVRSHIEMFNLVLV